MLRPDTLVVVVGDVVVPEWAPVELGVALVLVEIGREETVDVGTDFGADIPVDERRRVDHCLVSFFGVGKVGISQPRVKVVYVVSDVVSLSDVNLILVGIVDAHRSPIARGVEVVAVLEAIDFEQVAARDVVILAQRVLLLGDVHAVRAHVYLVADLVGAYITVVKHVVDELDSGIELERREGS